MSWIQFLVFSLLLTLFFVVACSVTNIKVDHCRDTTIETDCSISAKAEKEEENRNSPSTKDEKELGEGLLLEKIIK